MYLILGFILGFLTGAFLAYCAICSVIDSFEIPEVEDDDIRFN